MRLFYFKKGVSKTISYNICMKLIYNCLIKKSKIIRNKKVMKQVMTKTLIIINLHFKNYPEQKAKIIKISINIIKSHHNCPQLYFY